MVTEKLIKDIEDLGNFDKIVSLGQNCTSANYIKECNLKKESYPFDWIFSNSDIILDCLNDNFNKFLNKSYHIKLLRNRSGHNYYHKQMFNHRDITKQENYDYYTRCVNRFLQLLQSNKKILFFTTVINEIIKQDIWYDKSVCVPNKNQKYSDFINLEKKILSINSNCKFIYVNQKTGYSKRSINYKKNNTSIWIHFESKSLNTGSHYTSKLDGNVIKKILTSINYE